MAQKLFKVFFGGRNNYIKLSLTRFQVFFSSVDQFYSNVFSDPGRHSSFAAG